MSVELYKDILNASGGDSTKVPDNLEITLLKGIIKAQGGNIEDLPDNLKTTLLKRIADCAVKPVASTTDIETALTFDNAVEFPLLSLNLYGKSTQDGTPDPTNPVPIVSVGDDGELQVQSCGKNVCEITTTEGETNGLTITIPEAGVVRANGTTTAETRIYFNTSLKLPTGQYAVTCEASDGVARTVYIAYYKGSTWKNTLSVKTGSERTIDFDIGENTYDHLRIMLVIPQDTTLTNIDFSCMVRPASITDNTYEPYTGSTAAITSALPLCGLPVTKDGNYTDSNGQQWVCDELIYNADGTGKVVKRTVHERLSSSINFRASSAATNRWIYQIPNKNGVAPLCTHYKSKTWNSSEVNVVWQNAGSQILFDTEFTTVDDFKAFLDANEVYLTRALATPEEIDLTAEEMAQLYSYNGITNIFNEEGAEMAVKYCTNQDAANLANLFRTTQVTNNEQ